MQFTIWIDADSCPVAVRNHVAAFCIKHTAFVRAVFVANRPIRLAADSAEDSRDATTKADITMHVCPKEAQAADDYIFSAVQPRDAVITRDIPFAARLVERNICTMNDRGTLFTKENIRERLSERDFSLNLAQLGLSGASSKNSYGQKEFKKFADCFEREMQKLLIIAQYGEPKSKL